MIGSIGFAALWGILSLGGPWLFSAAPHHETVGPDHVPFVGQTPLLCGGAAASMLLRFWGERHVYGDDFSDLARVDEGGIATSDLVAAIRDRGFDTRVVHGRPDAVFDVLAEGIPSMLLLEGDPTLHYVVLVRADPEFVWIHDPNFGPDRRLRRSTLMDLWAESGLWSLVVTPSSRDQSSPASPPAATRGVDEGDASRDESPSVSAALRDAMDALRASDHARARALASEQLGQDTASTRLAHRILATSYHLDGRATDALAHWNALGEPTLDLLEIRGADHTRYHSLADRSGLKVGDLVTPDRLALARRRLVDVPAVRAARVVYTPLPDGSADVEAFVDERARWPGWTDAASTVLAGLTDGGTALEAGPFIAAGDRWRVEGRWQDAQELWSVSLSGPSSLLPGILTLEVDHLRERFRGASGGPVFSAERTRRSLALREWLTPRLALETGLAMERWDERRQFAGRVGATWALAGDAVQADGRLEHWRGDLEPFTRMSVRARARPDVASWIGLSVLAGGEVATDAAPQLVWPGAGTGEVRRPLLRGHPLTSDGVIDGAAFGRELVHATAEVLLFERFGPVRYGVAGFVDGARIARTGRPGGASVFLDPGVGLVLDDGQREVRVDVARGDGSWTLSAGVRATN